MRSQQTLKILTVSATRPKLLTGTLKMKTNQFTKRWGVTAPRAKFTQLEIDEIRSAKQRGVKEADLADQFNVHRSTINRIVLGQSYSATKPTESIFDRAIEEVLHHPYPR